MRHGGSGPEMGGGARGQPERGWVLCTIRPLSLLYFSIEIRKSSTFLELVCWRAEGCGGAKGRRSRRWQRGGGRRVTEVAKRRRAKELGGGLRWVLRGLDSSRRGREAGANS